MKFLLIKALLVAGQALDSHSSWQATANYQNREGNSILASADGRYRHKGIAINVAITGAVLGFGIWREKRHPEEARHIAALQGALAGFKIGTAVHNYRISGD